MTFKSLAQSDGVPEGTSYLTIYSDQEADNLHYLVSKTLFSNGYEIKSADSKLGIIQTEFAELKGGWKVKFTFETIDRKVAVMGFVSSPGAGQSRIINKGAKGSLFVIGFNEMERLITLLPHQEIIYGNDIK